MNPLLPKKFILFFVLFCFLGRSYAQEGSYTIIKDDTLRFEYYSFPFAGFKATALHGKATYKRVERGTYQMSYVPNSGFVGLDTLTFDRWDNSTTYLWEQVIIEVKNSVVALSNDVISTAKDKTVSIDVLQNDYASQGALNLRSIPISSNGTASLVDGKIIFQPTADFVGVTYLTYVACDNLDNCSTATVSVLVKGDQPLSAETIELYTASNQALNFPLPDEAFQLSAQPTNGVIEQASSLTQTYIPDESFVGQDTLLFEKDGVAYTYIIHVIADDSFIASGPAKNDRVYTTINQPIEIDVRQNDLGFYRITNFTQPSRGSVSFSDGKLLFTPAPFFTGTITFTYDLGFIASKIGSAQVTVEVGNQEPELDEYTLSTLKNLPKIIRYPATISNFEFNALESPSNGNLEYFPGFQEIVLMGETISGTNMLVYTPSTDFTGEDFFELQYCVEGLCTNIDISMEVQDMKVEDVCIDNCVWPGDGNNDGIVDMFDLLELAYNIGQTGSQRNESIEWYGQAADSWDNGFTRTGKDFKHLDMNGDGIATVLDTAAISNNYYKTHNLTNAVTKKRAMEDVPLRLNYTGPKEPKAGDLVTYELWLGSPENPVLNFNGLVTQFNFNPTIFNENSISISFNKNAWPAYYGSLLHMVKAPWSGRLDIGYTIPGYQAISGGGPIGQIGIVIEEDVAGIKGGESITTTIEIMGSLEANGTSSQTVQTYDLTIGSKSAKVQPVASTLEVALYPNPAIATLQLDASQLITKVEIYNVAGQLLEVQDGLSTQKFTQNVGRLANGLYFAKVYTNSGFKTKKFEVMR